ncbi:MAG TPA: signal peptide peptidase SppA [Flavobacteriales bacterium]|nr:signal peptide peptidase SppA [Flavobacteriales bacterium]
MRQFLKFMFASMLGTLLIGVVLLFLFIGSLVAIGSGFSAKAKPTTVQEGSILHLELDQAIVDRGSNDDLLLNFGPFKGASPIGLNQVLASLENAKSDDHITGVLLDLSGLEAGFATVKEIREKLVRFKKESGKPVIAYSDTYSQGAYYLATAADKVYLQPRGDVQFHGLRSEYMFFKGMFEKLDIDIQFIRGSNNRFKSFGEVFTEDHMSEANRQQNRVILDGLWDEMLGAVAEARGLDKARLNFIADSLLVRNADDAKRLGLVDGTIFRDELIADLHERMSIPTDEDLELVSLGKYARSFTPADMERPASNGKLAVVYAEGDIMSGESSEGTIGSTDLSATIRKAREDSTIKAVVLRVNSPGGSGLASDVIWREVELCTRVKPVVVSMGDVAASGGYYISAPASYILAESTTITGSIGVFGIIPNMQGFFKNKLGITFDGEKTNEHADMFTVSRPLSNEEKRIIQSYIDEFYDGFKQRVADGRKMTVAQVDSIGQGRVWTGTDALRLGLVDGIGGLEAAILKAAELANISDYKRVELPKQKDLFQQIMEDLNGTARSWVAAQVLGEDAAMLKQYQKAQRATERTGIQARMPFDLEIR